MKLEPEGTRRPQSKALSKAAAGPRAEAQQLPLKGGREAGCGRREVSNLVPGVRCWPIALGFTVMEEAGSHASEEKEGAA